MLVEAWPDSVKIQDEEGRLPLHYALYYPGYIIEVIQLLVECWPESLQVTDDEGNLPLHVACWSKASPNIISYILHLYPQAVHFKNEYMELPLHHACHRNTSLPFEVIGELVHAWPESCLVASPVAPPPPVW